VFLQAFSYRSVESILKHHLDESPRARKIQRHGVPDHAAVRATRLLPLSGNFNWSLMTFPADHDSDPSLN
jgi:hypothetical protein